MTLYLPCHDKVHTAAAEAAAPAAAEAAALAAEPWIHGSISSIMNHIFDYGRKDIGNAREDELFSCSFRFRFFRFFCLFVLAFSLCFACFFFVFVSF